MPIFAELEKRNGVTVLHHEKNQGKGSALKTGINYLIEKEDDCVGVVTADSDGQHSAKDTRRVAETLLERPGDLILGTRDFTKPGIPFKSLLGNRITANMFRLFFGKNIRDTQTGLRGIGRANMQTFARVQGERYEYEMGMLVYAAQAGIEMVEVPIETIYINGNEESHFRPVVDSAKIYGMIFRCFFKYMLSSLSASFIDIAVFWMLSTWVLGGMDLARKVFIATVIARVISSAYNFVVNRSLVFGGSGNLARQALAYYMLVVLQMFTSALLVNVFAGLFGGIPTLVKVIVDTCLFFVSFQIQQRVIFKKNSYKNIVAQ